MDQLEMLWNYQQADMAVNRLENAIKRSPTRQKLVKYRDYLLEQQETNKHIESEVATMADRLEALKDAVSRTEDQLKALQARLESAPAEDAEAAGAYISDAKRYMNNITAYEQEIKRICKDASDRERQQRDVKVRFAKYKAEFDKLKVAYDEEYKDKSKELDALKADAEKKTEGISDALMERYRTIKRHSMPPLARLNGNQCSGCNMSLPSAVSRQIKSGELVECETCGRLLLPEQKEE